MQNLNEEQMRLFRRARRIGDVVVAAVGAAAIVMLGGFLYAGLLIVHAATSGCF